MKKMKQMSIEKDNKMKISTSYLQIFKKVIKYGLLLLVILFVNVGNKYPALSESVLTESAVIIKETTEMYNVEVYPNIVRERLQKDLINEVEKYIQYAAPTSRISSYLLVSLCQQYGIDITFVLAQGMLESAMGTKGKAVQTNSVWNVGAYDDGRIIHSYEHPNYSIEPYLILLSESYLGDKKDLSHLIKDNGFKNLDGYRYASAKSYESRLRTMILQVDMHSKISMYQDVMNLPNDKIMAYFNPIDTTIMKQDTLILAKL